MDWPGGLARVVALAFAAVVVGDYDYDDDGLRQHNSPTVLMFLNHLIDLSEILKKSEGSSKLEHWSNDDLFSSCLKLLELLLASHFLQPKRHKRLYAL